MKFLSPRIVVVYGCAVLLGALLFQVSQDVQNAEHELKILNEKIERERDTIHVLNAEWAYLNRPQRLEVLAKTYLGMEGIDPQNMAPDLKSVDHLVQDYLFPVGYQAGKVPPRKPFRRRL